MEWIPIFFKKKMFIPKITYNMKIWKLDFAVYCRKGTVQKKPSFTHMLMCLSTNLLWWYLWTWWIDLTQMVSSPTSIPGCKSHSPAVLIFFIVLTLVFVLQAFTPLGNSDHVVLSVSSDCCLISKSSGTCTTKIMLLKDSMPYVYGQYIKDISLPYVPAQRVNILNLCTYVLS